MKGFPNDMADGLPLKTNMQKIGQTGADGGVGPHRAQPLTTLIVPKQPIND
jgi:hypothetical protein